MKVGHLSLGDAQIQYGLNLVADAAKAAGYPSEKASRGVSLTDYDVLLIGLYWWEHVYDLCVLLHEAGIDPRKRKPIIIVGGVNVSLNPLPFSPLFHYAVGGDGEAVIGDLLRALDEGRTEPDLPGVWWPGRPGPVPAAKAESLTLAPFVQRTNADRLDEADAGGQRFMKTVRPVTYIEIGRGCPHRCRFCALSALKEYRELPFDVIERGLRKAKTKAVCLFAPERSSHPAFDRIADACRSRGMHDTSSDLRLERIGTVERIGLVQFGLEGLSPRLRRAVGKPLSRERFADLMEKLAATPSYNAEHHAAAQAYLIGGLPGETEDDYREFAEDLAALNGRMGGRFVFRLTINWFIPQPFTALQWHPVDPFASWRKPAWWAVGHGANRNRFDFTVAQKETLAHPVNWLRALFVTRGEERHFPLLWALATNDQARGIVAKRDVGALLHLARRVEPNEDRWCGTWDRTKPMPWQRVWLHRRVAESAYLMEQADKYDRLLTRDEA